MTFEQLIEIIRDLSRRLRPERVRTIAENLLACALSHSR
jgi:hypothetical protein